MQLLSKPEITIESISSDGFNLNDFFVSKKSRFSESHWDFRDDKNLRLNTYNDSKIQIDWSLYVMESEKYSLEHSEKIIKTHHDANITLNLLQEIKIVCFLQLEIPSALKTRGKKIKKSKPTSVCLTARTLVTLFATIDQIRYKRISHLAPKINYRPINSISEISLEDLDVGIQNYPFSDGEALKKALRYLCTPLLKIKKFNISINWNKNDLENLKFPSTGTRDTKKVMPNELFRMLSDNASLDVAFFSESLKWLREDKETPFKHSALLPQDIFFAQAWEDYIEIRIEDQEYSQKLGKKSVNTQLQRKAFKNIYGLPVSDFRDYITRVQRACMLLIGLYTGGRYSDLASFNNECIKITHGMPMLVGTHIKNQSLDNPINDDLWPAIPIIVDAVKCLREISRLNNSEYLISKNSSSFEKENNKPLSSKAFTDALNAYMHAVDTLGKWKSWSINPHQLRHTLAHQLEQANVATLYISYQLKHLHNCLTSLPPSVTLGYGHIADNKVARATAAKKIYKDATSALYDPESPIAGGGAEDFIKRRKIYFDGRMAEGWSKDEIIEQLTVAGAPFVNVGTGYCGGKRETIASNGEKISPPCIGSLQCNTGNCHNAIITQSHAPIWKEIVIKNKEMAADPRLSHALANFKEAISTGERVLSQLSVDI